MRIEIVRAPCEAAIMLRGSGYPPWVCDAELLTFSYPTGMVTFMLGPMFNGHIPVEKKGRQIPLNIIEEIIMELQATGRDVEPHVTYHHDITPDQLMQRDTT